MKKKIVAASVLFLCLFPLDDAFMEDGMVKVLVEKTGS